MSAHWEADQWFDDTVSVVKAVTRWLGSPVAIQAGEAGNLHAELIDIVEQAAFDAVLEETSGNQLRAASRLGINRNTLRLKRAARGG